MQVGEIFLESVLRIHTCYKNFISKIMQYNGVGISLGPPSPFSYIILYMIVST